MDYETDTKKPSTQRVRGKRVESTLEKKHKKNQSFKQNHNPLQEQRTDSWQRGAGGVCD